MPVKRAHLLVAFLVTPPVNAEISADVKATCMEAKDFVGCVQALSGGMKIESEDDLGALRSAMKQVSARIAFGTSLYESTLSFRPVVDQLAIAPPQKSNSLAVKAARKATALFDIYQQSWQARVNSLFEDNPNYGKLYRCSTVKSGVALFNSSVGSNVIEHQISRRIFGIPICDGSHAIHHESQMAKFVAGVLKEGSVSPEVIEKYEVDRAEKYGLASMSAWERHLDKNPGIKQWALANPSMAKAEQAKFNAQNPQKEVQIPAYAETLRYLSKLNPPL